MIDLNLLAPILEILKGEKGHFSLEVYSWSPACSPWSPACSLGYLTFSQSS